MKDSQNKTDPKIVVGLGEVLFDCFPDRKSLGGAPINVAVHASHLLAEVGGHGVVVSRVGKDAAGEKLLQELASRSLKTDLIQHDPKAPTGKVNVTLSDAGEPTYEICEGVAWDNIEFTDALEQLAAECSAVCFGTLAQRSHTSRTAIQNFLAAAGQAVRLFDVNLRQDYYNDDILRESLRAATVVKLNQEELLIIGKLQGHHLSSDSKVDELLAEVANEYDLKAVALTRGSEGTVLFQDGTRFEAEPSSWDPVPDADNVGAGDACAAGLVFGLLMDWQPEQILNLANEMGAFVASQPGATPALPESILKMARTAAGN